MSLTRDSLGGQNSHRRVSSARSSRALSTIFKSLRDVDRKIGIMDRMVIMKGEQWVRDFCPKFNSRRDKLDQRRKILRLKRKGYTTTQQ